MCLRRTQRATSIVSVTLLISLPIQLISFLSYFSTAIANAVNLFYGEFTMASVVG